MSLEAFNLYDLQYPPKGEFGLLLPIVYFISVCHPGRFGCINTKAENKVIIQNVNRPENPPWQFQDRGFCIAAIIS